MAKMLPILMLLSLLSFSHFLSAQCSSIPAMYVFGDSLNDNGNLPPIPNPVYVLPYGRDFPRGPTGRATNGKNFPDLIADYLELKPYPPAYRKRYIKSENGYNYASGGCGILPETGSHLPVDCWSLSEQVNKFRTTKEEELALKYQDPSQLAEHLANSLFIIWAGNNDYLLNYFLNSTQEINPETFAQLLAQELERNIKELYALGARKAVIMQVAPLGYIPFYRRIGGQDDAWYDESKNQKATMFNTLLSSLMQSLATELPESRFTLANIYDLTIEAFQNPSKYGFTNVAKACCVLLGRTPACYPGLIPCRKRNEYLFFDDAHPTQAGFSIMARECFNGSSICIPNIKDLVGMIESKSSSLHSAA